VHTAFDAHAKASAGGTSSSFTDDDIDAVSKVQQALAASPARSSASVSDRSSACECQLAVAGGITPDHLPLLMRYSPSVLVVGGFVTE
jgi:3-keto-L-gulonate-6-phosphate decarboxylase